MFNAIDTAILSALPDPEIFEQERGPGVMVRGALSGNALVNTLSGSGVPVPSFVIGINGRGTLNCPEAEFAALLGCMLRVYLDREAGSPTPALPVLDLPTFDAPAS